MQNKERERERKYFRLLFFSRYIDVCWSYLSSFGLSLALSLFLPLLCNKQDRHARQIYPSHYRRDTICYLYVWFSTLSIFFSSVVVALARSLWLKSVNFLIGKHIYMGRAMTNAYLLSLSLCVCNDDHLSRDKRRGLSFLSLSPFSCACFCYSPSSNTILLANSHQFIHRRREIEPGERTKRL